MRKGLLALMLGVAFVGCDSNDGCVSVHGVVLDSLTLQPIQGINTTIRGGAWGIVVDVDSTDYEGKFNLKYCNGSNVSLGVNTYIYERNINHNYDIYTERFDKYGDYERRILLPPRSP
ncbi:MAG: hypothetical protein IAE99_04880 [Rhodothermales bacterium]|nr:hypothetical protein [Rhodothermales bacterium]